MFCLDVNLLSVMLLDTVVCKALNNAAVEGCAESRPCLTASKPQWNKTSLLLMNDPLIAFLLFLNSHAVHAVATQFCLFNFGAIFVSTPPRAQPFHQTSLSYPIPPLSQQMARGKPFSQSLSRLVSAGVMRRPSWMSSVEATRPKFQPIVNTRPPRIHYPEDRLRNIYLSRNPDARRIPVNLKAKSIPERHIADKFVAVQMRYMNEKGMSEEEAYNAADRELHMQHESKERVENLYGPLQDSAVANEVAKLYLASVRDSKRDQELFHALVKQAKTTE